MRMATSMVLVLIMAVGCSGAEIKDKTDEKGPAEDRPIEKASPEKIDPFQVRLDTFEAAYVDLVCRANRNYDPTGAFVKLHEPLAVIRQLVEDEPQSKTLDVFVQILKSYGYESPQAFFDEEAYIGKARPGYFDSIVEGLLDVVERCSD